MKILFAMILSLGTLTAKAEIFDADSASLDPVTTLANFNVGQTMKRYSVRVRNCANNISSVMLRVQGAGIQVNGAGITYTDGSADNYSITYSFPAEYDSPWVGIDSFKEAGKCVKSVYVNAQSSDPQANARVRVYGN